MIFGFIFISSNKEGSSVNIFNSPTCFNMVKNEICGQTQNHFSKNDLQNKKGRSDHKTHRKSHPVIHMNHIGFNIILNSAYHFKKINHVFFVKSDIIKNRRNLYSNCLLGSIWHPPKILS
ncbi:hypothetical protein SAMN05443292_2341 [Halpernia frigidisoli]|uniref:Uncharacterized protein n=1 Tax=Halpernia frigidisoli TaxID=1125876 RepID=A0A1I3HQP2_9FLAO|nr:hypothetical protein SAMN05443292_2341 [Halpernia frigidisoli]